MSRGNLAMTKDRRVLVPFTRNHQGRRGRRSSMKQPKLKEQPDEKEKVHQSLEKRAGSLPGARRGSPRFDRASPDPWEGGRNVCKTGLDWRAGGIYV